MQTSKVALCAALGTVTGSISGLPAFAQVDVWQILEQIQIEEIVTETTYEVKKSIPDALDAGIEGVEITGYAVPMIPGETVQELLLVSDMGLCPLCGNGDHNATLQVVLANPIPGFEEGAKLTLRGDLLAVKDPETWQAAILQDAQLIAQ